MKLNNDTTIDGIYYKTLGDTWTEVVILIPESIRYALWGPLYLGVVDSLTHYIKNQCNEQ